MLKIFTTQLLGAFKQIEQNNEESLEDCARMIAQTVMAEGKVYITGDAQMTGIVQEATAGDNALPGAIKWMGEIDACPAEPIDAVIFCGDVFTSQNTSVLAQLNALRERAAAVIVITRDEVPEQEPGAIDLVLSAAGLNPLVPMDNGEKIGHPASLSVLYLYHALYLNVMDILDEY